MSMSVIKEIDGAKYEILKLTCQRCGHSWIPRKDKIPDVCPNRKCKSRYWNTPKKIRKEAITGDD